MIVVARGGGSLADLFAFCDETLCRTVALLRVPVSPGRSPHGSHVARRRGRGRVLDADDAAETAGPGRLCRGARRARGHRVAPAPPRPGAVPSAPARSPGCHARRATTSPATGPACTSCCVSCGRHPARGRRGRALARSRALRARRRGGRGNAHARPSRSHRRGRAGRAAARTTRCASAPRHRRRPSVRRRSTRAPRPRRGSRHARRARSAAHARARLRAGRGPGAASRWPAPRRRARAAAPPPPHDGRLTVRPRADGPNAPMRRRAGRQGPVSSSTPAEPNHADGRAVRVAGVDGRGRRPGGRRAADLVADRIGQDDGAEVADDGRAEPGRPRRCGSRDADLRRRGRLVDALGRDRVVDVGDGGDPRELLDLRAVEGGGVAGAVEPLVVVADDRDRERREVRRRAAGRRRPADGSS